MGIIELMVLGMSTKLFWFIMWLCSMPVSWYLMGRTWPDENWDDSDLVIPMLVISALSPIAIMACICCLCHREGVNYKEIMDERRRRKAERQGGMTDEQLERLGVNE